MPNTDKAEVAAWLEYFATNDALVTHDVAIKVADLMHSQGVHCPEGLEGITEEDFDCIFRETHVNLATRSALRRALRRSDFAQRKPPSPSTMEASTSSASTPRSLSLLPVNTESIGDVLAPPTSDAGIVETIRCVSATPTRIAKGHTKCKAALPCEQLKAAGEVPDASVPTPGEKTDPPLRRRITAKSSRAMNDRLDSASDLTSERECNRSQERSRSPVRASKNEIGLLIHPDAPKEPKNSRLYPRMYKAVMEALKRGDLPQEKMQVAMGEDLVHWYVCLRNLRRESLFGQTNAELVVQLVWEYSCGARGFVAFPDVAPIMRVLTPTGIYTEAKHGACVLGLAGGSIWHGLEFKESVKFSPEFSRLFGEPSYDYKGVSRQAGVTFQENRVHNATIKEFGGHNVVDGTRTGKVVTPHLRSIIQYMQQLLGHFEFEDWRRFTVDEMTPSNGFYTRAQLAFKQLDQPDSMSQKQEIQELAASIAAKECELSSADSQKRASMKRKIKDLKGQRETAEQTMERQLRQWEATREGVVQKLTHSRAWNLENIPRLMSDMDGQHGA